MNGGFELRLHPYSQWPSGQSSIACWKFHKCHFVDFPSYKPSWASMCNHLQWIVPFKPPFVIDLPSFYHDFHMSNVQQKHTKTSQMTQLYTTLNSTNRGFGPCSHISTLKPPYLLHFWGISQPCFGQRSSFRRAVRCKEAEVLGQRQGLRRCSKSTDTVVGCFAQHVGKYGEKLG